MEIILRVVTGSNMEVAALRERFRQVASRLGPVDLRLRGDFPEPILRDIGDVITRRMPCDLYSQELSRVE